jgi:hypothetical protein
MRSFLEKVLAKKLQNSENWRRQDLLACSTGIKKDSNQLNNKVKTTAAEKNQIFSFLRNSRTVTKEWYKMIEVK